MIKLKDLLYETTDVPSATGAGQLWPFAERESYAKRWENARMENLFGGSLEGMSRGEDKEMAYIASINDIDDLHGHKPAGYAAGHWHDEIPQSVLGDWELVRYMFDMETLDRIAVDEPVKHPEEVRKGN